MNLEYIDVIICLQENGLNTDYYTLPAEIAVAKDFLSHYKSTPLGIGRTKHDDKIFNEGEHIISIEIEDPTKKSIQYDYHEKLLLQHTGQSS